MSTAMLDRRFQVRGLDRDTCVERTLTVIAETEEEAVRKAADLGMVVERVDKMLRPKEEDLPEDILTERTSIRTSKELRLLSPVERISWLGCLTIGILLQAVGWAVLVANLWAVPENYDPGNPAAVSAARLLDLRHGQTTTNAILTIIAGILLILAACQLHARGTVRRTHTEIDN